MLLPGALRDKPLERTVTSVAVTERPLGRSMAVQQDTHLRSSPPRGLAWTAAVAMGMNLQNTSEKSPGLLRTSELALQTVARARLDSDVPEYDATGLEEYREEES